MRDDHPLVPRHKDDLTRAEAAVAAGWPAVSPVLPDLLEWLKDYNWPVAHVLAPLLATVGLPAVPHVRRILASDDDIWKRWILSCVVEPRLDVVTALRPDLERIVLGRAEGEVAEGVIEIAEELLRRVIVSFRVFFSSGVFGPVDLGAGVADLESAFGAPEATGGESRKHRNPTIWKYGDVEFFFNRTSRLLDLIHVDRFTGPSGAPAGFGGLRVDPWIVRAGLPRQAFCTALVETGIGYVSGRVPRLPQQIVSLDSGVELCFFDEPDPISGTAGLVSIHKSVRPHLPKRSR
jgi:hypothetical protein